MSSRKPTPPGDGDDDGAGYKKPQKKHRFKKGKSGNPLGRPKRKVNVAGGILEPYIKPTNLRIKGKIVTFPQIAAVLLILGNLALRGDLRAAVEYLKFAKTLGLLDYLDRYLKGETATKLIIEYVDGPETNISVVET